MSESSVGRDGQATHLTHETVEAYEEEIRRLRKERDAALREKQFATQILDGVYQSLGDTIIIRDAEKRVVSSNCCYEGDSGGRDGCNGCTLEAEGKTERLVDEVLSKGEARWNRRIKLDDGELLEVNAYPLIDDEGQVQFVIEYIRDITRQVWIKQQLQEMTGHLEKRVYERTVQYQQTIDMLQRNIEKRTQLEKRMKALLRQLEISRRDLKSFNYSVSHDLKAPLRIVENYARILEEDHRNQMDEEGRSHINRISHAVQRMRSLIDDLLTLSRINRVAVKRSRIDLAALVREAISEGEQYYRRPVVAEVENEVIVHGDQGLLWVAVKNLVDNAVKYSMEQEEIRIIFGSQEENGRHVFYIRDKGAGFAMDQADKLFTPFKRLHSIERFSGTGIGLATVQRVIQRHGGEIWAESEAGKGAVFYFTLSSAPDIFYPYEVQNNG